MINMAIFEKTGQAMLPDRPILKGQKLTENVKNLKCDILSDFQTI